MTKLLTVRELAAVLHVSERAAYRVAGRVPHYKVGRQLRFRLDEVLDALHEEPEPSRLVAVAPRRSA